MDIASRALGGVDERLFRWSVVVMWRLLMAFGVTKSTSSGGVNSPAGDEVVCARFVWGPKFP